MRHFVNRRWSSIDPGHSPLSLVDSLESRQMMAQSSVVTFGNESWTLNLTGSGSYTAVPDAGFGGLTLIALSGTDLTSNFSVTRVQGRAAQQIVPKLNIEKIIGGTLNSITLEPSSVDLRVQDALNGMPASDETGILLTGYARQITVGDMNGTDIRMDSTSSANRSTISARFIRGVNLAAARTNAPFADDDANISSAGVIDSFTASNYRLGTLVAERIGSIRINNVAMALRGQESAAYFDIVQTNSSATYGVKTIDIAGSVYAGDWSILSPVQRISVGNVAGVPALARGAGAGDLFINIGGRLGQYTSAGSIFGSVDASSIGSIVASAQMSANITIADQAVLSNTTNSIDSIRARNMLNNRISAQNGIGLLNIGFISDSTIGAGWIGTLNVTRNESLPPFSIVNTEISVFNSQRQVSLTKMNLQGFMSNSDIRTASNVGDVSLRGMVNGSALRVGTSVPNGFDEITVASFANNKRINALTFTAPLDAQLNLANSFVAAGVIGQLNIIKPNVKVDNSDIGGGKFGFAANTIESLTYLAGPGSSVNRTNIVNPELVLTQTDFRIQVF